MYVFVFVFVKWTVVPEREKKQEEEEEEEHLFILLHDFFSAISRCDVWGTGVFSIYGWLMYCLMNCFAANVFALRQGRVREHWKPMFAFQ